MSPSRVSRWSSLSGIVLIFLILTELNAAKPRGTGLITNPGSAATGAEGSHDRLLASLAPAQSQDLLVYAWHAYVFLQLVAQKKIDKNLLPPKKIIGKNSRSLVEKREKDLEVYLQTLLATFPGVAPRVLAHFLHFQFYVSSSQVSSFAYKPTSTQAQGSKPV